MHEIDKPWKVTKIELTADAKKYGRGAHYRYYVEGVNHWANGQRFTWQVPSVDDARYDLSDVIVPELPEVAS